MLPDLGDLSIPGDTVAEKALMVILVLIIGIGIYSKVTGKPITLALRGITQQAAQRNPGGASASYYAQQNRRLGTATDTMFTRMNLVNPARVNV